jgi:hypothetical protein
MSADSPPNVHILTSASPPQMTSKWRSIPRWSRSLWAKDLVTVACCQDVGESAAGSLRQQIAELTAILMDLSADETDATDLWAMCGSPGE